MKNSQLMSSPFSLSSSPRPVARYAALPLRVVVGGYRRRSGGRRRVVGTHRSLQVGGWSWTTRTEAEGWSPEPTPKSKPTP